MANGPNTTVVPRTVTGNGGRFAIVNQTQCTGCMNHGFIVPFQFGQDRTEIQMSPCWVAPWCLNDRPTRNTGDTAGAVETGGTATALHTVHTVRTRHTVRTFEVVG